MGARRVDAAEGLSLDSRTIVAIATPPGRGALGVVRVSGGEAFAIARGLVGDRALEPRRAALRVLRDADGEAVDEVVATAYEKPNSYTGEDIVELSCHGSAAVLRFVVERAMALGARLAEPGEYTQRAFLNGRMDLVEAEAVNDLIEATTLYQARVAASQVGGALSRRLAPVKQQFVDLIAILEAGIDFAEDDIDVASEAQILARLDPVLREVEQLAAGFAFGKVVRGGIRLAILGRPNVGKSSLFNRLLARDRAIVTPTAGTTRDWVTEHIEIDGVPVEVIDTAGIRATTDEIEALGVEKSYEALADADVVMVVLDLSMPGSEADEELMARAAELGKLLAVGNKADLGRARELPAEGVAVSAKTGAGLDALRAGIAAVAFPGGVARETAFVTNIRHATLLKESAAGLRKAREAVLAAVPHEMLLLDLYTALEPFDAITGATTIEDILGNIFSRFCIGK